MRKYYLDVHHGISVEATMTRYIALYGMLDRVGGRHHHSLAASMCICSTLFLGPHVARAWRLARAVDLVRHVTVPSLNSLLPGVRTLVSAEPP